LAGSAEAGEEEVKFHGFPSVDDHGETTDIKGGVEFDGLGLRSGFAGKGGGDEVADFGRELGYRAGAGAAGSAEEYADEMAGVGFPFFARFGGFKKTGWLTESSHAQCLWFVAAFFEATTLWIAVA